jgi:hypothetical protein
MMLKLMKVGEKNDAWVDYLACARVSPLVVVAYPEYSD